MKRKLGKRLFPKTFMKVHESRSHQPMQHNVPSSKKCAHAEMLGRAAWKIYTKSITANPYRPGILFDAWQRGYLAAVGKIKTGEPSWAAEPGREQSNYGIMVVKRSKEHRRPKPAKRSKLSLHSKENYDSARLIQAEPIVGKLDMFLDVLPSPANRKFRVWTRNPPKKKEKEKDDKKEAKDV